jgi:hypothetical protein
MDEAECNVSGLKETIMMKERIIESLLSLSLVRESLLMSTMNNLECLEDDGSYYNEGNNTGLDVFVSGDLEINNEAYNNPAVLEILRELAPFDWGQTNYDGLQRVKKPIMLLENGAKYEGEWISGTEMRDGRGI